MQPPGPPQQAGLGGGGRTAERFAAAASPWGPWGPLCAVQQGPPRGSSPFCRCRHLCRGGCLPHLGEAREVFPPGAGVRMADVSSLPSSPLCFPKVWSPRVRGSGRCEVMEEAAGPSVGRAVEEGGAAPGFPGSPLVAAVTRGSMTVLKASGNKLPTVPCPLLGS